MSVSTQDFTEIINQARCGDTAAFARIVRQYQSLVSGVLFSATGDFHRSEDLAQETFLIAWKRLNDLRDEENIAAWLCTIARNLAHRSFRKYEPTMDETPVEKMSPGPGPEAELLRREQSELVWSAIGEIPEAYREILVLYYRSGQSVSEIAEVTASTEEAVRQRLVRARKSLKSKLETMIGDILTDTAPGDVFTLTVMTALGAAMISSTAQAAVTATTGAAALGTGSATGGKALGAMTLWNVIGPVMYVGWFAVMFFGMFWAAVRNAPTLRTRRYRAHSIFWCLQYYPLLCIAITAGFTGLALAFMRWFHPTGFAHFPFFFVTFPALFLLIVPFQLAYYRRLKRITENDLGLPGPHVESYSYPQVERRFFLSIITNILVSETVLALFVGIAIFSGEYGDPIFLALIFGGAALTAVTTAVYYPLGRYFLEICRTKRNFLAASPLIDNPLEVVLLKSGKAPGSVDHLKKAGKMSPVFFSTWFGIIGIGIWYFAQYSWDKHPIPLGICAVLLIACFSIQSFMAKKAKNLKETIRSNILFFIAIPALLLAMEYIEFGGFYWSDVFTKSASVEPRNLIHVMNMSGLLMVMLQLPLQIFQWLKVGREESSDEKSGREKLLREAIARFDPATMIDDESAVEAKPFPKRWLRIFGLYAAAIVVLYCIGVLVPNPYAHRRDLIRSDDFTALITLEPNNPEWYYKRGIRYQFPRSGTNVDQAIADFDKAIELKPDYALAYSQRAQAESTRYQGPGITRLTPEDVERRNQEMRESNLKALADIDKAIELDPINSRFYNNRASIRTFLGDMDGAEADYTQAIDLQPSSLNYSIRGGFYDYSRKDTRKAIADYTEAIRLAKQEKAKTGYSEFPPVILYRDRARLYEKLGEPDKAKADLEKAK